MDASRKRTHGVSNGTDACRRQIDRGPYAMRAVATYAETRPSGAQRRSGGQWWCARGRDDPGEQAARRLQEDARDGLEGGRRDDEARGYGAGDGRCVQGTDRAVRRRAMPGRRAVAGPFTVGARHRADLPCDHRVDRGRRQASREGRQHMQCHRQQADPDRRKADAQCVVHGREINTASRDADPLIAAVAAWCSRARLQILHARIDQDAGAEIFVGAFEARGNVHAVTDHRVVHASRRADIAGHCNVHRHICVLLFYLKKIERAHTYDVHALIILIDNLIILKSLPSHIHRTFL